MNVLYRGRKILGVRATKDPVKQHPTGFIGGTDDIIFSTESGV